MIGRRSMLELVGASEFFRVRRVPKLERVRLLE